jgi:asparagine synthase (glutamine-hydrolysing)
LKKKKIGIAFSGGVDSSLLLKICLDLDFKLRLITVGFSSWKDIDNSYETANFLGLEITSDVVSMEELDRSAEKVLKIINFDRLVRFENCLGFYHVFKLASREGYDVVLSGSGLDELFCGYFSYKNYYEKRDLMMVFMNRLVRIAKEDKKEIDKIAAIFKVKYECPFLFDEFVDFAINIPLNHKILGEMDSIRKHILREIALEIGVPRSVALKKKKAFQYSSGMHKALLKLVRQKDFTKKKALEMGFQNGLEAYLHSLKKKK